MFAAKFTVAAPVSRSVRVQAKSKAADFRGMSIEEIDAAVAGAKRELFDMRLKQASRQVHFSLVVSTTRALGPKSLSRDFGVSFSDFSIIIIFLMGKITGYHVINVYYE